jgi:lipoprotein signal peptidase
MHKIAKAAHKSITTRRAMPELWFEIQMVASIGTPFSMWTGNRYMTLICIALLIVCAIWYMLGYRPVRKPVRRAVTTTARTRARKSTTP